MKYILQVKLPFTKDQLRNDKISITKKDFESVFKNRFSADKLTNYYSTRVIRINAIRKNTCNLKFSITLK